MFNPLQFEHAVAIAQIPLIKSAIKVSGVEALLFKAKDVLDTEDEVYGVYAGNKIIEESRSTEEDLKNPYGTLTINSVEQDYGENYVEEEAFNDITPTYEAEDLDGTEGIPITILMSSKSWRVSANSEYGLYESDDFIWSDGSVQIDNGDVILINRPYGGNLRLKITFIETLGLMTNIAQRFKAVNLG